MDPETLLAASCAVVTFSFYAWCFWVTDAKHPERLKAFLSKF